jgi:hypothetical protein
MTDIMKYLGGALHRVYDAVVQRPMPWRMIDKLSSLEEAEEAQEERRRQSGIDPLRASGHSNTSDQPPPSDAPRGRGEDR